MCQFHLYCLVGGEIVRGDAPMNTLLHIATISGILANLMRYFRASLSSLPLLNLEVGKLPMGTWSPDVHLPQLDPRFDVSSSVPQLSSFIYLGLSTSTSVDACVFS